MLIKPKASIYPPLSAGFTLVEVMVVIVILSIFAGMMTLSVGSTDTQKQKAFYEHLQSNLNYVRLLSAEAMQPYGIAIKLPQNGASHNELVVVKMNMPNTDASLASQAKQGTEQAAGWQVEPQISPLVLPQNVDVIITPLDNAATYGTNIPNWLVGDQAPPVVWFGTGEATPVQITVKVKHSDGNSYLVDDPIVINNAGAIEPPNRNQNTSPNTSSAAQQVTP